MYSPNHLKNRELRIGRLKATTGIIVVEKYLDARRENANGRFLQFVPGHGGDVIAVTHHTKQGPIIAVYRMDEVKFKKPIKTGKRGHPRKKKKLQRFRYTLDNGKVLIGNSWAKICRKLPEFIRMSNLEFLRAESPRQNVF